MTMPTASNPTALLRTTGGPDVLALAEAPPPRVGAGQVVVRNHAAGVNAIDLLIRRGDLPPAAMPALPHVLGVEGAGVVEAVAPDVAGLAVGDRVLWFGTLGSGGYGALSAVDARYVARVGEGVGMAQAAASPVIYTTALHMLEDYRTLAAGDWVLVRSAAGGVGAAALQLCRLLGLRAIAVTTAGKLDYVRSQGATAAIDYLSGDVPAQVRALVGDEGVALALNPVGGGTVAEDLALLQARGQLVIFGFLGGLPEGTFAEALAPHFNRSVGVHVSDIYTFYQADPAGTAARLAWIAAAIADGRLEPPVGATFDLSEAGAAHRALEGGSARGKLVLLHPGAEA